MRSMAAPLNAVASSTLAMARQSRDAIRVHAMVPDPSDSALAVGGTSVESQSRGAMHVHCMVWPEHVAAQTLMDAGVSPIHDCSNAQL
jgi:hypothetical protein